MNLTRNMKFHQVNSLKKEMKRVVIPLIPEEYRDAQMEHFELTYELFLPNKLKRDISNVCGVIDKFACDAVVECGALVDDNYNHLKKVTYKYGGYDPDKVGYCIMTIQEVDGDGEPTV